MTISVPDTPQKIFAHLKKQLKEALENSIKELLETKHLYQRATIPLAQIFSEASQAIDRNANPTFAIELVRMRNTLTIDITSSEEPVTSLQTAIKPNLQNVRLYCSPCKRREAFAPVWGGDPTYQTFGVLVAAARRQGQPVLSSGSHQFLVLMYQCQGCQGDPEIFLLSFEKKSANLSIAGRFPIERVETPAFIPKIEQDLYRDALIAYQSGKILAGLFYLRAFIEQFARRITGLSGRVTGEEIMSKYTSTLGSLSSQMPSLREWYEKLSAPLHDAREDDDVFRNAIAAIDEHFDIRRVFKVSEKPAQGQE